VLKVTVVELFLPECESERDVTGFLIDNPSLIEADAKFIADEIPLIRGKIDLLFSTDKEVFFVEVKRKRSPSDGDVVSVRDQLFKYYEGVVNLCKIFGVNLEKIRMCLVIGYSKADGDKRYDVEFKDGNLFYKVDMGLRKSRSESLSDRYVFLQNDLRQSIILLRENYKVTFGELEEEKEKIMDEITLLKLGYERLELEKNLAIEDIDQMTKRKENLLQRYGEKLLYILPEYWENDKNSRNCFICDIKSEVIIQHPNNRVFGLCSEHFKEITKFSVKD